MADHPLQKILYVEDDLDIQGVAQMALEMVGGYTVEVCSSGRAAIEAAPGFAPDLFLLDVMMPDLDGPATLKALRELPGMEDVPAVFMTAKVMPADIEAYKAQGVADVIAKPFDPMTLAKRIADIWNACHGA